MLLTKQDLKRIGGAHDKEIGEALRTRRVMDIPCSPETIIDFMKRSDDGRRYKIVEGALPEVCEFIDCYYRPENYSFYIRVVSPEFPSVPEHQRPPEIQMTVLTIEEPEAEDYVKEHWDELMEILKDRPDDVIDALKIKEYLAHM